MFEVLEPWDSVEKNFEREWNQPEREKCVAVIKAGRHGSSYSHLSPLLMDRELQDLESVLLGFILALGLLLLHHAPIPLWNGTVCSVPLYVRSM